jgi:hypothetical protein
MDDMMLLATEYVFLSSFIGFITCIYLSCFLHFERKELQKFVVDEIEKKMNKTM